MSPPFNGPRHPWSRLTSAARRAPDDRDPSAPYGFATRVAALALAHERTMMSLFERFALRAVVVAGLLALGSVALNYGEITRLPASAGVASAGFEEYGSPNADAVAVVLDIAD